MIPGTVAKAPTKSRAAAHSAGLPIAGNGLDAPVAAFCWALVAGSWVGISLAEAGRFSAAGMLAGGAVLWLAPIVGQRILATRQIVFHWTAPVRVQKPTDDSRRLARRDVLVELALVAGLLLLAAFLYLRPSEAIFGTHDAGGRLNAAAHLAQAGSIAIADPNLPVAAAAGSLEAPLGVYVVGPLTGQLLPQFSGVAEVWEALALSTLDLPASLLHGYQVIPETFPERPLYLPAMFGLAALLVWYAALRRAFGRWVALTATAGLAISYPEITFARLTMAEIPTQFFCATALFGLVLSRNERKLSSAALAGAALGLAYLTHVDAILLYLPALLWLGGIFLRRRLSPPDAAFFGTAGFLLAQGTFHYLAFEGPYVASNLAPFARLLSRIPWAPVVSLGLVVFLMGWLGIRRISSSSSSARRRARLLVAAVVVMIAAGGYFVRPLLDPPRLSVVAGTDVPVVANGGVTLVLLGSYVFPLTLALALVGVAVTLVKGQNRAGWIILLGSAPYLLLFGWTPFVSPPQPFWVRRFVPEVLPSLPIYAALGILAVGRLGPGRRGRAIIVGALTFALLAGVALVSRPLWTITPEDQGALAQTNALARALPANSLLVFDRSAAASRLPLPLSYLFRRDSFVLTDGPIDQVRLRNAVDSWRLQGKTVAFVTGGGQLSLDPAFFGFRPLVGQRFRFTEFPLEYWAPPTSYRWVDFYASAYELVPPAAQPPPTFPFTLELGRFDYPYLVAGFHVNDYTGQTSYRYTFGQAAVRLPRPSSSKVRITIRMAGQRPADVPPARLRLTLDRQPLGEVAFPTGADPNTAFHDYPFEATIDATSDQPLDLAFDVNSWRPADYGLGDILDIGVAVVTIRVEPG